MPVAEPIAPAAALDKALDTFPKLLVRNAAEFGARTALRKKTLGIWRVTTWQDYHDRVRDLSLGLISLGLKRGEKVAIIGSNRPEWLSIELAAQAAGAVPVGVDQDSSLGELAYIVDHCDASLVYAENQEQVDKLLEVKEKLPRVKCIVYCDPRGLRNYKLAELISFQVVEEEGRKLAQQQPNLWQENVSAGAADDIAMICYTAGTTGFPKGAMLSFFNLLTLAHSLQQVNPKYAGDESVSFLPLSWIGEQMVSVIRSLMIGFTVNFPERPRTAVEDMREIGPHLMVAPPRVWRTIHSRVEAKIRDTTPFKRSIYQLCMPVGNRVADLGFRKQRVPLRWRLAYQLANLTLFRALKDRIGLSRLRSASTAGGALGPDVFRFFHALGVPLKQVYGQTELGGFSAMHTDGDIQFHTVGRPLPGTEIKIATNGEILSRSSSLFLGYYKSDAATRLVLENGWLHSGDAGYWTEDGHLVLLDRLTDIMELADGTRFSPQFIENSLRFSPYIKEAVVIGKDRPFVTAMLCIDMRVLSKWAESQRIPFTTYSDLSAKPQSYDLLQQEIEKVNATLPQAATVRRFVLLYKELHPDDEELTRMRKVRRVVVEERYANVIAALYGGASELAIDTVIKLRDGRSSRIRTTLLVRDVGSPAAATQAKGAEAGQLRAGK